MIILLAGLISAVLTGVATFFYLRLFRRIRDTVESKGSRVLYYCLASLTYYVLAKVTGVVSVGLGLLPTLIITHYLPRRGLRIITFWSAVLAAVAFVVGAAAAYRYERENRSWNLDFSWLDTTTQAPRAVSELNRFFISDKIDPTLEFDIVENVKIENRDFKIPIFKDSTYEFAVQDLKDAHGTFSGTSDLYTITIMKDKKLLILCTFQGITTDSPESLSKKMEQDRNKLILNIEDPEYFEHLTTHTQPYFASSLFLKPRLVQNTQYSTVLYSVLDILYSSASFEQPRRAIGVGDGIAITNNSYVGFVCLMGNAETQDTELRFMTWINEFININSIDK